MALAKHSPKHIYFTGRNKASADKVTAAVESSAPGAKVSFIECDQLSLASVAAACKAFLAQSATLDVLLCNAGVMATEPGLTKDGYENQFGVNHVAHALMVKMLLPALQKVADTTGDARVLFLTSLGFMYTPPGGVAFDGVKTVQDLGPGSEWARYGQSKLANILYPAELARRYPALTTASVHPGTVGTDIIGRLKPEQKALVHQTNKVILEPHQGAYNSCWCATTARGNVKRGELYMPVGKLGEHTKDSSDSALAEKLWTWTQEEISAY